MPRRILSILLLFLYLIPSIGISGSVHYCGGEIAAIVLIPTDEHPCACGPDEPMDGSCCQDKAFSIKIKDNHKNTNVKIINNGLIDFATVAPTYEINFANDCFPNMEEKYTTKEVDPPDDKLYILFESYLI